MENTPLHDARLLKITETEQSHIQDIIQQLRCRRYIPRKIRDEIIGYILNSLPESDESIITLRKHCGEVPYLPSNINTRIINVLEKICNISSTSEYVSLNKRPVFPDE